MSKKWIFGLLGAAAAGAGAIYAYKKFVAPSAEEDDFDDDIDEFDLEDDDDESREYVSINIDGAEDKADEVKDAFDELKDTVEDAASDSDAFNA